MGLSAGPVPSRVDARVKAGLLELLDHAVGRGWDEQAAADLLGVHVRRARRWRARSRAGRLSDAAPGGVPGHAILPSERAAILELYEAWKDIDRSHRKLAHRGSREALVWVSEATVLRVLRQEHLILPGNPPREPGARADWPDWVAWRPNSTWIQNFPDFSSCSQAAIAVMDVVSRYWLTTLVTGGQRAERTDRSPFATRLKPCGTPATFHAGQCGAASTITNNARVSQPSQ